MPPPRVRRPTPAALILLAGALAAATVLGAAVLGSVPPPASPLPIEGPTTTMPQWAPDGR